MSDAGRFEDGPDESRLPQISGPQDRGGALMPAAAREDFFRAGPEPVARPRRDWRRIGAAASLAGVVLIGGAAAAAHVHALRVARAEEGQARALAHRLDAMTTRLEAVEASRTRDDLANLKKVLVEIKAGAAGSREVASAVGQLSARVDKLEKDQGAKLDKLGERIDHEAAARLADVTARLEKLEGKASVAVAATPSPPLKPAPVAKTEVAKTEVAKTEPTVSAETTGSVEKPKPRLRGYFLSEVHNGYAMIDSPEGEFSVAPGDVVPGGGRVLRIERHGRDWVVVTTQGMIASD